MLRQAHLQGGHDRNAWHEQYIEGSMERKDKVRPEPEQPAGFMAALHQLNRLFNPAEVGCCLAQGSADFSLVCVLVRQGGTWSGAGRQCSEAETAAACKIWLIPHGTSAAACSGCRWTPLLRTKPQRRQGP